MDTSPQPTTTPPPVSQPSAFASPPEKKHGASKFAKILLLALFGAALLGGGYYFGTQTMKQQEKIVPPTAPTATPTQTPSPAPTTSQKTKTVKAGMPTSPYAIEVPLDWTDVRENTQTGVIDKLTLSKNGYTLTIYQAAMGGGGCLYPGDKPAEMASSFTDFTPVTATTIQFRRSWNQPEAGSKIISYTICQKAPDNSYGNITGFGVINAVSPNPANPTILTEIDSMLASLKKD